jgi:uncharacterized membrane protein
MYMRPETIRLILFITPMVIGGIIAAINNSRVNTSTEMAEDWVRRTQKYFSVKKNWFARYLFYPLFWAVVFFFNWSDSLTHQGIKNGIRVAATLYILAAWCFLIYLIVFVAFTIVAIVIVLVVIYFILTTILSSSDNTSGFRQGFEKGKTLAGFSGKKNENSVIDNVGLKGKNVYSGTNWFNEELAGRVDKEGNIYKGTNWFSEEKIGRIDSDGNIYSGSNFFNEESVGRIDKEGNLYKGSNWFIEEKTGRIDKDGNIIKGSNWFNEEKTGRAGG